MIPTIGIMVGFYIVARLLGMIAERRRPIWVKVAAGIAIAVAMLCMYDLVNAALTPSPSPMSDFQF